MRAKRMKKMMPRQVASGSREGKAMMGYHPRQHQDMVPECGQGPQGNCAAQVPWGDAPAVAPPPVGAGKGFKGW